MTTSTSLSEIAMVSVTIPGEPVAQERPRVRVQNGKPRLYDPQRSANWKATAQGHMLHAMNKAGFVPFTGPVRISVVGYWTCPVQFRKKATDRMVRPKRPDASNVLKAVEDAANGVLFLDDAQIIDARVEKYTAKAGEPGRIEITVEAI